MTSNTPRPAKPEDVAAFLLLILWAGFIVWALLITTPS